MAEDDIKDLLEQEAQAREKLHEGRPTIVHGMDVGMAGEWEFAKVFHQPLDLAVRPGGDDGVDFVMPLRFTVDVKCARVPAYLIVEKGKIKADIYVLAEFKYNEETKRKSALLLGWEFGANLENAPTRDFGYGKINHYIRRENLRDIGELKRRVMRLV